MPTSILIVYASRYGSTREVAESIGSTLREQGISVDVQSAGAVKNIDAYALVVLGAPLYMGQWLKDAKTFLSRYQERLLSLPVAVFALGPLNNDEKSRLAVREQFDKELVKFPWLKPVSIELFTGKYDPSRLNFLDGLISKLPASPLYQLPASDLRDWDAIRIWAKGLTSYS